MNPHPFLNSSPPSNTRRIKLDLDLETSLDENGVWKPEILESWATLNLEIGDEPLAVDIIGIGLYRRFSLVKSRCSVAEILVAALKAMKDVVAENPLEYRFKLPLGFRDLQFVMLLGGTTWTVRGERKERVKARTTRLLHPERSIDLFRKPNPDPRKSEAKPMLPLDHVWLTITDDWQGNPVATAATANQPMMSGTKKERIERFPGAVDFRWGDTSGDIAAERFLKDFAIRERGVSESILAPFQNEVVWFRRSNVNQPDLRSTISSAPEGPAPLPSGVDWPRCLQCSKPTSFAKSLDFRDASFAHLLPGSTLSVFACSKCIESGDWDAATRLQWLSCDIPVELKKRTKFNLKPSPIVGHEGYVDYEIERWDLPPELQVELFEENPPGLPFVPMPERRTKVGGCPAYLQNDPTLLDATGIVMEYIGQFSWNGFNGFGYVFHSTITGETTVELQST